MRLFFEQPEQIANWVSLRIPHMSGALFGPCTAIGVANEQNEIAAGIVFHDYQPRYRTIQVSVAARDPRWATAKIIKQILSYPFLQLGVNVVWSAIAHDNARAIKFNKGIGFTPEGVGRFRFGDKHAWVSSMTAKEYNRRYQESAGKRKAA